MVAELWAAIAFVLAVAAELLHTRRTHRIARLAFGPNGQPAAWVRSVPVLVPLAMAALTWGALTLHGLPPLVHKAAVLPEGEYRHVVLVLDVSPSMRLVDAGPTQQQSRMHRAKDVMESFFKRVSVDQYRISVVATYNGAKPVVIDTKDVEVVRNILEDLPLHHAFKVGKTDLFAGLAEAARIAKPWKPRSTTVIVVSDGDTVPAVGMPKMPDSVAHVLVVGIGDAMTGRFIDGKQSRQDRSTLRQIATRLNGNYHDGNERHLSSSLLAELTANLGDEAFVALTRREYAMIAIGVGALLLAWLPFVLHHAGSRWRPGRHAVPATKPGRDPAPNPGIPAGEPVVLSMQGPEPSGMTPGISTFRS